MWRSALFVLVAASSLADVAADSSSLSLMSGSALGRASAGPSGFSGLKNRLRGGAADLKEKVTGITFTGSLKAGGKNLEVVGAGDRKKKIVGPVAVNVYAIGMYVDPVGAKAAGATVTDAKSAAKILTEGTFTKSLRLIMARTVGAEKIGDALAEQLEPRIKGTGAPLDLFKTFFKSLDKLETKQEVTFTVSGTNLIVEAPGNKKGNFSSAPLCKAMFDIYLGDTPVSDNAKKSMVDGFLSMCGK